MEELKEKIRGMEAEEALAWLDSYIDGHPEDDRAYFLRGLKRWGAGRRGEAMTDYLAAVRLNPESPAQGALTACHEILDYRNKDLYNP